ncbi:unnamed protein product [Pieris macdunnoughi]|uniref:Uncharacterized protein n=1 Tax=Pieris macdunnoughi TaxID=345717 RepID=A0A821X6Y8_9NEOP|nr:unnamed protein product [Pieris macdunnoughi]
MTLPSPRCPLFISLKTFQEERRRTGRYIAILVGICLLLLAIYHAWVRRIPVVASLVVPALIMFVYVGWVLFTASRDKKRLLLLDAEAALRAAEEENCSNTSHMEISVICKEIPCTKAEVTSKDDNLRVERKFVKPIILVNDRPAEDLDEKWTHVIDTLFNEDERLRRYQKRRKFRRRFCRRRQYAVFKRSYSIG